MKILVVDDSKAMRMIVTRTLKQAGFKGLEIVEATNGLEGVRVVAAEKPDLVLSDWNMPEMNGIEFLRKLREDGVNVTFGFVTTESTESVRQEATQAGATFFITKPFTAETFESVLGELVK